MRPSPRSSSEQLGARRTARGLATLGRKKIERCTGIQAQCPTHGLRVDERLGMGRQPARVVDGSLARLLVTHRGVGKLKLLDTRTMLVVDYHGAILGIHIYAVDAPAERPTGILDLELVERKLRVARGKGGQVPPDS